MEKPTVMSVLVVISSDSTHPTGGGSCKSTAHQHVTCLHVAVMAPAKPCDLELASSVEEALRSEGRHNCMAQLYGKCQSHCFMMAQLYGNVNRNISWLLNILTICKTSVFFWSIHTQRQAEF